MVDLQIGDLFPSRRALHDAGVHRGLMHEIAPEGLSIVLSGGYTDNENLGDEIIHTVNGGTDFPNSIWITYDKLEHYPNTVFHISYS